MSITLTQLCEMFGKSNRAMDHVLRTYGPPAAGRIGNVRYWEDDQLPTIRASVARCQENANRPFANRTKHLRDIEGPIHVGTLKILRDLGMKFLDDDGQEVDLSELAAKAVANAK
jgi:hypothetical protein